MSHLRYTALVTALLTIDAGPAAAGPINPLVGVNFQPYIGAWTGNPLAPPLFNSYTYADVLADLTTVKAEGFTSIKTYGVGTSPFSGNGTNLDSNQYNVTAAHALGLSVQLGANLQYANGGLDLVRTHMEIDLAIKQAVDNPGTVRALLVGNECIGVNGVTVADLVSLMDYAKTARMNAGFTAATLPVSTVQQWGVLAGSQNAAISQAAEGAIYANIYPFFDARTTIGNAVSQFNADSNALRSALDSFNLSGLAIAIGETGWATAGVNSVNPSGIPSVANAQQYFQDYLAQVKLQTFMFEAFDEPWKANPVTDPNSVESHFGLLSSGFGSTGAPVPEPSTLKLMTLALATVLVVVRRDRRDA
jgi:exo-beta-1,3-glucanase (GH17 family)